MSQMQLCSPGEVGFNNSELLEARNNDGNGETEGRDKGKTAPQF